MENIDLLSVKPASYNPRVLSDDAKDELKKSLSDLGCVKPIIVNKSNMTIIAGHQRTKTMLEMGITQCPAFLINNINMADEVRFNQFHNRCEYEYNSDAPKLVIKQTLQYGYNRVYNANIKILDRGKLGVLNNQLCRLLTLYGEFGAPICDINGNVIISSAYAYATKIVGKDMYVYVCEESKLSKVIKYFSRDYGKFNYDKLKKETYIQGLAQMKRLRDGRKGKENSNRSTLYERLVIPYLEKVGKSVRILDFGAGQMDYAKKLKSQGYNIHAVEPYHFKKGSTIIDFKGNTERYLTVCRDLKRYGQYDIVVCDSVLNSVDSKEAENAVIRTCKALTKVGGMIFISGRRMEEQDRREHQSYTFEENVGSYVNFYDENGFTALYRNGQWFYQKFHDAKMRKDVLDMLGTGEVHCFKDRGQNFSIVAKKQDEDSRDVAIAALCFEFNMILPNGKRYGLQNQITDAYDNRKTDNQSI